jgi:ketosteroid isomerase-like protein
MDDSLLSLERDRCRAIAERDFATLEALLASGYIHVHSTGLIDDRAQWLERMLASPSRKTERGELRIVTEGDTAVMVGAAFTTVTEPDQPPRQIVGIATQAWARHADSWQLLSFQVTPTKTA